MTKHPYKKYQSLNKSKSTSAGKVKLTEFLDTAYTFPVSQSLHELSGENPTTSRSLPFHKTDDPGLKYEVYKFVAEELAHELKTVVNENQDLN